MGTKVHTFGQEMAKGKIGEDEISRILEKRGYTVKDVSENSQKNYGIDRYLISPGGLKVTAEIKTDTQGHRTGNAFIEFKVGDNPGWVQHSLANWLLYYVRELQEVYLCSMGMLKHRFEKENWEARYPVRAVWTAGMTEPIECLGVLVPLGDLREIALEVWRL